MTTRRRGALVVLAAIATLIGQIGAGRPAFAATGTFVQYTYSGPTGSRPYSVYTPAGYTTAASVPLIVMLHGCTESVADFASLTQMNALADSKQFIVVYPQQTSAADSQLCWHWYLPEDQARGSGEAAIIAGITQTVMANAAQWNIDSNHVYLAGFSAGAAMAVVMGATYPDLYAAIGEQSGLEYKAAVTLNQSWSVVTTGGPSPTTQGQLAYSAMGSHARVLPVIVFHGTSDTTVYPINGDQVVQQYMVTDNLVSPSTYAPSFSAPSATVTGTAPVTNGQAYTVRKWNDSAGNEVQEYWTVSGMNHAWSGGTSGSFPDPYGPSATQNMYAFFIAHALAPPAPPTAPPLAPTGLTASASSSSQINLSWTGSSGATGYQVQRSPDGSTGWTQIGTPSTTSYSDTGLAQSTVYYYQVLATNSIGPSGPSSVASARTQLAVSQTPQGTWVGTYGKDGYALLAWNGTSGDLVSLKPATLTLDQATRWTWRTNSTLVQDLQSPDASSRRATCVFDNNQLRLHLTFTTAYIGTLHLYALDASTTARREVITVNDGKGPQVANLNSSFNLGAWVSPAINVPAGGAVTITIDHLAGYNAVLSGLFLG